MEILQTGALQTLQVSKAFLCLHALQKEGVRPKKSHTMWGVKGLTSEILSMKEQVISVYQLRRNKSSRQNSLPTKDDFKILESLNLLFSAPKLFYEN